jgi:hypothetical protein
VLLCCWGPSGKVDFSQKMVECSSQACRVPPVDDNVIVAMFFNRDKDYLNRPELKKDTKKSSASRITLGSHWEAAAYIILRRDLWHCRGAHY